MLLIYLFSAAIAFTAQYPIEIQSGYQMGIGLSTLIGSCFRILTKLALPTDAVVNSSLLFFYSGAFVIVLVTMFYTRLLALPCSEKYIVYGLSPLETKTRQNRVVQQAQELIFLKQDMCESSPLIVNKYGSAVAAVAKYSSSSETLSAPTLSSGTTNTGSYDIFLKIYPAYFPVLIVYSVTLLLWPPLITEIHSFNFPALEESQWWSLILLFLFALMDCVGRYHTLCAKLYGVYVVLYVLCCML